MKQKKPVNKVAIKIKPFADPKGFYLFASNTINVNNSTMRGDGCIDPFGIFFLLIIIGVIFSLLKKGMGGSYHSSNSHFNHQENHFKNHHNNHHQHHMDIHNSQSNNDSTSGSGDFGNNSGGFDNSFGGSFDSGGGGCCDSGNSSNNN
ncbi:hypothetical protein [Paenibacillus sp. SI8]|uniref:hypothetical protein n=1 Tax=unclassified Paenibacillus TaxID=185978 RepID=UPI0034651DE4